MPVAVWRDLMEAHFPGTEWLRMRPRHRRGAGALPARRAASPAGTTPSTTLLAAGDGAGSGHEPRPAPGSPPTPSSTRGTCSTPTAPPPPRTRCAGSSACSARRGRPRPGWARRPASPSSACCGRRTATRRSTVHLRFLQLQRRLAERATGDGGFEPVGELRVGDRGLDQLGRGGRGRARAGHVRARRRCAAARTSPFEVAGGRGRRASLPRRAGWSAAAGRCAARRCRWTPRTTAACCGCGWPSPTPPDPRAGQGRRAPVVADRRAPAAGGRRGARFVSVIDPPADARAAAGRCTSAPVLAGAGRRRGRRADLRRRAGLADHPVRPPRGGPRERRRDVRLDRDRRDPHPAGDDADRRGEGRRRGPRTRRRRRSSTAASRCRPRSCSGCTASCATRTAPDARRSTGDDWWAAEAAAPVSPGDRRRAGRRRPGRAGQPGAAAPVPARRRPGHVLRPGGAGQRPCTSTSTARRTSRSCWSTTRRPSCTTGTAATSTSPPTNSNRSRRRRTHQREESPS